ncbi:MAG TPA: hypothetical protein VK936_08430 [Longimicrobiales bacterium]|nr:hypothetical protein [Longimicrobiales bacterium]
MSDDIHAGGEDLPPRDHLGCLLVALRTGCGMTLLWALMAMAILGAALVSLLFFR